MYSTITVIVFRFRKIPLHSGKSVNEEWVPIQWNLILNYRPSLKIGVLVEAPI